MEGGSEIHGRPAGHFLAGDPAWWTPPVGPVWSRSHNDEEDDRKVRAQRNLAALSKRELSIPDSCSNWRRQRLRQLGTGFLLPAAISPMFVAISLMFLFLGGRKGFSPVIPVIVSALALGLLIGSFAAFRERRIGMASVWRTWVTAPLIPLAILCSWGPWRISGMEAPLALLMNGVAIAFLVSSSKAVSKDGARFLLPVPADVSLTIQGSAATWIEGRIHHQVVERTRVLQLSGERIKGQRFLVLDLLGHLDVRWDPLQEAIEKEVRSAAISLMRENDAQAGQWPEWALPRKQTTLNEHESE